MSKPRPHASTGWTDDPSGARHTGALLARSAARAPERAALIFGNTTISYSALDLRASRVANALAAAGVDQGDRVALYAANGMEWVETFFGVARLGAVLVPVSSRLLRHELERVVAHARPSTLIFDAAVRDEVAAVQPRLPASTLAVQIGDVPPPGWARGYGEFVGTAADSPLHCDIAPGDLQSICYTAGTTGQPKGAMLTHANIVVGTHEMAVPTFGYSAEDVFLNPAPLAHRAGAARLIQSIGIGATHVLVGRFIPHEVLRLIEQHRVTLAGLVPTMIRLLDAAWVAGDHDTSSLRTVIAVGESCPAALRRRVFELFPGVELVTLYASTEAGLIATLPSEHQLSRPDAAGRAVAGVEVQVLGEQGIAVAAGEVGEITVRTGRRGSRGVMLGYLDDPAADDTAFEGDWFRTGDCGRIDEDGFLVLEDRKKDMILSGGLNVYSREVEDVLLEHPAVSEVAVVGVPDATWGESVAAAVVPRPEATVTTQDLVQHCRARLASYKKPRRVVFLDRLPRNAAGKVLKYLLRERLARSESPTAAQPTTPARADESDSSTGRG